MGRGVDTEVQEKSKDFDGRDQVRLSTETKRNQISTKHKRIQEQTRRYGSIIIQTKSETKITSDRFQIDPSFLKDGGVVSVSTSLQSILFEISNGREAASQQLHE
jgi:hypothetical protein